MTTWTVELDADPDTTGQFVLDQSALDGPDVLGPDERWIAIPGLRVLSIAIRRGGSDGIRPYDAGECVVELDNASGDFDPDNPYGFYVTTTPDPEKLLTQGAGLRVKINSTTDAAVFTGYIEEPAIRGHWANPTAVITATDLLANLGGIDVPPQGGQTGTGDTSSVRAHWLLDQAGVPTSKRSIAAAGRQCLGTTGGGTVRTAIERVVSGEAGRFFVSRDGLVTLTWHDAEYTKTSQLDFLNTDSTSPKYTSIETSPGIVGVINQATVKRIVPQVRNEETGQFEAGPELPDMGDVDGDSAALYGTRAVTAEVVLLNEADAASLAHFLAYRRSRPTPRLAQLVSVQPEAMTSIQAQALLEIDLGDLITVTQHTIDGREILWVANIENIAIDHSSPATHVTFATSPSDTASVYGGPGWFVLDVSALDGPDVLAPF